MNDAFNKATSITSGADHGFVLVSGVIIFLM